MLKRDVTYEDFNGLTVTETFYFNLSKTELVEMEYNYEDGFGATLEKIVEAQDNRMLISEFKKLILMAYGEKSEDGKRFVKNDQLREDFSQTAAFNELFMELATDDKAASAFINAIVPKDISKNMTDELERPKTTAEIALEQSTETE